MDRSCALVERFRKIFQVDIPGFCARKTHVPFLLRPPGQKAFSAFSHRVNSAYATYFNQR